VLPSDSGDPIIGFITRGKGVTVHLRNCQTIMGERETARMIEVEWEGEVQQTYPISIRLEAYDRTGLLSDVTQVVAENKVNILAAQVAVTPRQNGDGPRHPRSRICRPTLTSYERLEQLKDVISVQRDWVDRRCRIEPALHLRRCVGWHRSGIVSGPTTTSAAGQLRSCRSGDRAPGGRSEGGSGV